MRLLSDEIFDYQQKSSWIRRMFAEGMELKKKYGEDNVYDFSLGNPDLPPPPAVKQALFAIAETADQPFALGYMENEGRLDARTALAKKISQEQNVEITPDRVIVTCGAAGGLNVLFRAVLEPGDEVMCPAPYFVEYKFYASNFRASLIPVPSNPDDFSLDLDAIDRAITSRTRIFIINSPNNPTGRIYSRTEMEALAAILKKHSELHGRPILLASDEPYRFLNFENLEIPSVFSLYTPSVVVGSFSKNLALAGERIGYIAVNPAVSDAKDFIAGLTMTNRILGFVNAPIIAQKILTYCLDSQVEVDIYRRKRDLIAEILRSAGIDFALPSGTFYFFPKCPIADESAFINALVEQRVLVVPGSGFGMPGYFRMAFCCSEKTVTGAADPIRRAVKAVRG